MSDSIFTASGTAALSFIQYNLSACDNQCDHIPLMYVASNVIVDTVEAGKWKMIVVTSCRKVVR